jgi:hypothetical protein
MTNIIIKSDFFFFFTSRAIRALPPKFSKVFDFLRPLYSL